MSHDPHDRDRDRAEVLVANQAANDRDRTAEGRDERADAHDVASAARDRRAEARDERAEARELAIGEIVAGAAADRAGARRDRKGGASDRVQAADDRSAASSDRLFSADEREEFAIDKLTGALRREVGLVGLAREIERAVRTEQPFSLAFVDVDHLKECNDEGGHAAGDALLQATVVAIRAHLRSYDLIVRFGGDEFLCGILDVSLDEATKRFAQVNADLAATGGSVTIGLAELAAGDDLDRLVSRADGALYAERKRFRRPGA